MKGVSNLAGVRVGAGQPVRIMAVLNVSPESFYSGSVRGDAGALHAAAQRAVDDGAHFVDVGAMSTAPYRDGEVPLAEEIRRMTWALGVLAKAVSVPLSADTKRAAVAAAALASGARIINDVTGFRGDAAMADVAAMAEGAVLVASEPCAAGWVDPLELVRSLWRESLLLAERSGIAADSVVLDPGIGFFTRQAVPADRLNCLLLDRLGELGDVGRPILAGISRKAFVGRLTGREDPSDRLAGSLGAAAIAVYNGAAVVRTHDVAATRDAVRIAEAIRGGASEALS